LRIDDPQTTILRRRIVREKAFLRQIYEEWYKDIAEVLPEDPGMVLELGSGPGFMKERIPGLFTSEVFRCPGVDLILDGTNLPIADGALRAIVMTDALHHLPDVRSFFAKAERCVRLGGAIVMIEPWVTSWSRLVYKSLHDEPFDPDAREWELPKDGPLTGANGALPWILFERDYGQFKIEFPGWQIKSITHLMPFRYLLSGGVSTRRLMPDWSFRCWARAEGLFRPWMGTWAMFARIVLVRVNAQTERDAPRGVD
jgi:SAM-dependent methyltransferase